MTPTIGNVPYSLSATAKKGSPVSFVRREEFSRLMLINPSISVGVLRVLAAKVHTARGAGGEVGSSRDITAAGVIAGAGHLIRMVHLFLRANSGGFAR